MNSIVLGGGCFWCLEATYQLVSGIEYVSPGYSGGEGEDPNYYNIQDHAEVVKLEFNEDDIKLGEILEIFWSIHDPTTINRQGNDIGSQYRSIILYKNSEQLDVINNSLSIANQLWNGKIITKIKKLNKFYEAEDYHRNYFMSHPEQAYCQAVINPKLEKFRKKFAEKLK
ncbi:MAG: peptide-methionine (S)-S-oxide reductase MsrA [Candidatus Saccharimonadales bacterium]